MSGHDTKLAIGKDGINSFFIPGWQGESLVSKPAIRLKKILNALHLEAIKQLNAFQGINRSLKQNIYKEFLSFAQANTEKCHDLENYTVFWLHLKNPNSPFNDTLQAFTHFYCFRVATIYLFKIRFILQLSEAIGIQLSLTNYLNPTSFLTSIFQKGSSRELDCPALQANQYSWFRPTQDLHQQLLLLGQIFHLVSINEMMKICTYKPSVEDALCCDHKYSHSLSHKAFGVFINDLLLKFPQWLSKDQNQKTFPPTLKKNEYPRVVNCKFSGDYLLSFTLSHWLAQEHEIDKKWSEIISPEFTGDDFDSGDFVKYCHELQFLAYLVIIAEKQNLEAINLICQVMGNKREINGQISMFPSDTNSSNRTFDRIILNASKLPKKNPHHSLTSQISDQIDSLKQSGFIIVMTNQNFFVNSRSQKIEQILNTLKLEAFFDFNNIKGKGEIPGYFYIFSKRSPKSKQAYLSGVYNTPICKESCLTFKASGNLSIFNKFFNFVHEVENFFINKNAFATPIYQKEISEEIFFEYYQDAIVDGKLLQCASRNSSKITHPNFFRNLTKSCIPFGNLFQFEHINPTEKQRVPRDFLSNSLLNASVPIENKYPLMLIVNQTDAQNVQLEIINSENYKAKLEKYGTALFQYFGLTPKTPNLNINLFRDFFANDIGHQIIQLSLNEGTTKLKSKLQSLLIPKFFGITTSLPSHLEKSLIFLKSDPSQILSTHPKELTTNFAQLKDIIVGLSEHHPWHIMSLVSHFKYNVEKCIAQFCDNENDVTQVINYNNPLIIESLIELKSYNIYPNNSEVYVDILASSPQEIHLPFSYAYIKNSDDNSYIELYSQTKPIIQIYSDPTALSFIKYILTSAIGTPISAILESLSIPAIDALKDVLNSFSEINLALTEIQKDTEKTLTLILNSQISSC